MDDCCPLYLPVQSIAAHTPAQPQLWKAEWQRRQDRQLSNFGRLLQTTMWQKHINDSAINRAEMIMIMLLTFQIFTMSSLLSPFTCSGVSEKLWSPLQLKEMLSEKEAAESSSMETPCAIAKEVILIEQRLVICCCKDNAWQRSSPLLYSGNNSKGKEQCLANNGAPLTAAAHLS